MARSLIGRRHPTAGLQTRRYSSKTPRVSTFTLPALRGLLIHGSKSRCNGRVGASALVPPALAASRLAVWPENPASIGAPLRRLGGSADQFGDHYLRPSLDPHQIRGLALVVWRTFDRLLQEAGAPRTAEPVLVAAATSSSWCSVAEVCTSMRRARSFCSQGIGRLANAEKGRNAAARPCAELSSFIYDRAVHFCGILGERRARQTPIAVVQQRGA